MSIGISSSITIVSVNTINVMMKSKEVMTVLLYSAVLAWFSPPADKKQRRNGVNLHPSLGLRVRRRWTNAQPLPQILVPSCCKALADF